MPIWVGDGYCDDITNIPQCNYDNGDCCGNAVNTKYCLRCICLSNETIEQDNSSKLECLKPDWVGDGYCDDSTNHEACDYDGGDCCGYDPNKEYCSVCACINATAITSTTTIAPIIWGNSIQVLITSGHTGGNLTNETEIIDIDQGMQFCANATPTYPINVMYSSSGLIEEKYPLICGGQVLTGELTDQCHVIPNLEELSPLSLPFPMAYMGHAVVNNSLLWLTGGIAYNSNQSNYFYMKSSLYVDLIGSAVHLGPDVPNYIYYHCMVSSNALMKAIIIGGYSVSDENSIPNLSDETHIFSFYYQSWFQGPPLNMARAHFTCGMLKDGNDHIVVAAGGLTNNGITKKIEFFNLGSGLNWYFGPDMTEPRYDVASFFKFIEINT